MKTRRSSPGAVYTKIKLVVATGAMLAFLAATAYAGPPQVLDVIISEVNAAVCGHDFSNAVATVKVNEGHTTTRLTFKVYDAKPNHIYTVWYKLASGSPLTGIGATPAAPTSEIDNIFTYGDTAIPTANAFYTNSAGNGTLHVDLDFPLSGGVYPFSQYDLSLADVPSGNSPFTFRLISHCTDLIQHGLTPGVHEPTFQISLSGDADGDSDSDSDSDSD